MVNVLIMWCGFEQLDTRRILKRLAKENLKQLGRMVAKIAHANPMTVLRTIVHQVQMPICSFMFFSVISRCRQHLYGRS